MGVVCMGYDDMIDRKVAIKSLRLDKLRSKRDADKVRELFFREAKTIGKLSHSHIAAIYDVGQLDGNPYLVMEYVNGKTIKDLIKSGAKFKLEEKLALLSMIARALHYAHRRGVIHRDIKPANIMILPNRSPKIMDFGIASVSESLSDGWTGSAEEEQGVILGTPGYMSPEQILSKKLDPRSDVFALGILAYEWIASRRLFPGKNMREVLSAVISKPINTLKKAGATGATGATGAAGAAGAADARLSAIVAKALEKDPENRYGSAEQFSDAMELYLNRLEMKSEEKGGKAARLTYDNRKIIDQLKANYLFFSDFSNNELFDIFKLSGKEKYQKGEVIIQEGSSGAKMYIIIRGSVAIVKGTGSKKLEINRLEEGACFGEMAIIDKMPRFASAVAAKKTSVIAINEIVLRENNPQLCLKLYRNLAAMISEKLRLSDSKYMDVVAKMKNGMGS